MVEADYQSFKGGVKACLPTVFGYLGIGFAAGVIGKSIGLSIWEIFLMSTFIYAGSAQFIICGLIAIHSPVSAIIFTTFLVNLRHLLMSMSVATYFEKQSLLSSIGVGTLLTDESYGVLINALHHKQNVGIAWTHGLNLNAYLVWIAATVLGGSLGAFLPQPQRLGLDFALLAMFIGLFVLQVELPFKKQIKKTSSIILVVCLVLYVSMRVLTPEVSVMVATLIGWGVGMVVPFVLTKRMRFAPWLIKFLSYIPICILTALVFQSMLETQAHGFPKLKTLEAIASVPTLIVAMKTKDLMKTVVVGIVTMAILRII